MGKYDTEEREMQKSVDQYDFIKIKKNKNNLKIKKTSIPKSIWKTTSPGNVVIKHMID